MWLLALAVGGAVFFAWIGYARTLDPLNLQWIFHEDPFSHAIGWEQLRNAPIAQYPLTRNEQYGLEWSSTLVFTDSIPAAALILRPLSELLPRPFQYLGWWTLLSLVLQAYFGARLLLLRTERLGGAAIAAVLFATAPVMLERIGLQAALGSHWLVLWALWLYLDGRGVRAWAWSGVLLLAVSVHAYLFVMVGGIWAAHLVRCRLDRVLTRRDLAVAGATVVAVAAWMHALGYFVIGDGIAGGGWRSSFDLLGFVAPARGAGLGLVSALTSDTWDGSAYLGAGVLALIAATAIAYVVRRRVFVATPGPAVRWTPLVVMLAGFTIFAMTNQPTIAGHHIASLALPHAIEHLYETFRGAHRMVWPVYYVVLTTVLWRAISVWPARQLNWALAAALALQLVDLEGVAAHKRAEIRGPGMIRPLRDPMWSTVAQHYQRLLSVPSKYWQADWPTIAWFAARHRLGCNVAYVSRTDQRLRIARARVYVDAVATGRFDRDAAYYFPSAALWSVARETMDPGDLAVVADGMHLILPGGRAWVAVPAIPQAITPVGEWISFADPDSDGLLLDGWWPREAWGTWSTVGESWLALPVPRSERIRVTFRWISALPAMSAPPLRVHMAGQAFTARLPPPGVQRERSFELTTTASPLLDVRFEIDEHSERGPNERALGLGLIAARVERVSELHDEPPAAARAALVLDRWISFASQATGRAWLGDGWSWGEAWGTWSAEPEPVLALPVPPDARVQVTFRWLATAPPGVAQTVRVDLDDRSFDVAITADGKDHESSFEVTTRRRWLAVRLEIAHPIIASDRLLGVGLKAVRVRTLP